MKDRIIKHKEGFVEYRLVAHTLRTRIQVFVGNPEEEVWKKFWKSYSLEGVYEFYNSLGFYIHQDGSNIIRCRGYDLGTLVHELTHFIHKDIGLNKNMFDEDEAKAYTMESMVNQAMWLSGSKFKFINNKNSVAFL